MRRPAPPAWRSRAVPARRPASCRLTLFLAALALAGCGAAVATHPQDAPSEAAASVSTRSSTPGRALASSTSPPRAGLGRALRPLTSSLRDRTSRVHARLGRRDGLDGREAERAPGAAQPHRPTTDAGGGGKGSASADGLTSLSSIQGAGRENGRGEGGTGAAQSASPAAVGEHPAAAAAARLPSPSPSPSPSLSPTPPPGRWRAGVFTPANASTATPTYAAFLGIMSRPVTPRRAAVRAAWLGDVRGLEAAGVYARFVIGLPPPGDSDAAAVEAALAEEAATHGDLFRVGAIEAYDSLLLKVLAFFRGAVASVDASFYLKTDDDVFVRPDRVPAAVAQWDADGAGYTGCMFLGGEMIADRASPFYEPHGPLFSGSRYFGYMSGGFYGLSAQAAAWLGAKQPDTVRLMGCGEDCSVGLQMLALPVRVVEDWRVCTYGCRPTSIAVTDGCNGLCNPLEALPALAATCSGGGGGPAAIGPLWAPDNQRFVSKGEVDAMGCTVMVGGVLDRSACRKVKQQQQQQQQQQG